MKNDGIIIIIIILCLKTSCNCRPHNRIVKDENISKYRAANGEPVAISHLIQEYEHDHLRLVKKEGNKNDNLGWKHLENKNLNDFCRKYLHHCVERRTTHEATGRKITMKLCYTTPGYELLRTNIVVVSCAIPTARKLLYHFTQALESNCVYALSRIHGARGISRYFTIIYKHCNFELHYYEKNQNRQTLRDKSVHLVKGFKKRNKQKYNHHRDPRTGQFIADDGLIMKYELEHQEMRRREKAEDFARWPFVTEHKNLHEYCFKYLNACVPSRQVEDAVGSWSLRFVQWRINMKESFKVVVVKCYSSLRTNRSYYFTKALDKNCVYALLRHGTRILDPFLIIFKHCNFDHPNMKREILENNEMCDHKLVLNGRIKTEDLATVETLQIFPMN